jgi:molybdopterin molybdotransferase
MRALRLGATFDGDLLLAPDAAIAAYLAAAGPAPSGIEEIELASVYGRVLARDAVAEGPYPQDDRSTMDGYAVRSADGTQARRITGTIRMGHAPPGPLHRGEAMRIPTGGVLPPGADAVVPVEDAREQDEILNTSEPTAAGTYITPRGDDMAPGDVVLRAGRRVAAAEMSVLATLGRSGVFVYRRPRVAVLPTGDELVDVAQRPGTGQVRDSNRWAIAGGLTALGCDVVHLPRAADDPAAIASGIGDGLTAADAVILTGGSSVGVRDHVPAAIDRLGAPGVIVHGLKVKPGKPTVLAAIGTRPVIGLPGNPASALTILDAVVSPILRALTGEREARRSTIATRAAAAFPGRPGWTWYVPAQLSADGARPLAVRSAHTSLLARADGYVVVGPEGDGIEAGVPVVLFRYGGSL